MIKTMRVGNVLKVIVVTMALGSCSGDSSSQLHDLTRKEAWDRANEPSQLLRDYVVAFSALPLQAQLSSLPWPDSYWPSNRGGVAYRWRTGETPWNRELYPLEQLRSASVEQIAALSPAEKYDILRGRYDYPLTNREKGRTSETNPSWWGLCHGWAQASTAFREPQAVTISNDDGLRISFGSSDIKALLTYAQQDESASAPLDYLGLRCEERVPDGYPSNTPACKGVNAGSFHIILTNRLGLVRQSFVMDVSRDYQVWNQPVYGFESEVIDQNVPLYETAAAGTAKIIRVKTKVHYVVEQGPYWNVVGTENVGQFVSRNYHYTLELNDQNEIIGGEWDNERRPDFLWSQERVNLTGDYFQLGNLYAIAVGEELPIDEEPIDEEPIDEEPIDEEPIDEEPIRVTGYCAVAVSCVYNGSMHVLYADSYDATRCATGYQCPTPENNPVLGAWGSCERSGNRMTLTRACQ